MFYFEIYFGSKSNKTVCESGTVTAADEYEARSKAIAAYGPGFNIGSKFCSVRRCR